MSVVNHFMMFKARSGNHFEKQNNQDEDKKERDKNSTTIDTQSLKKIVFFLPFEDTVNVSTTSIVKPEMGKRMLVMKYARQEIFCDKLNILITKQMRTKLNLY